jgi:hypothetical protein
MKKKLLMVHICFGITKSVCIRHTPLKKQNNEADIKHAQTDVATFGLSG